MQALNSFRAFLVTSLILVIGGVTCGLDLHQLHKSRATDAAVRTAMQASGHIALLDSSKPKFAATGDNSAGWKIDSATGDLVTPAGKVIEGLNPKQSVNAVCSSNVASLSGTAVTCDGVALNTVGVSRALLTAQSTATQKGCWIIQTSAWSRCPDFAAGSSAAGAFFVAQSGTSNKGIWVVTNASGSDVVGTNDLTTVNLNGAANIQSSQVASELPTTIRIRAVYSLPLPANTYNNGTSGVGATLTMNSNAALPAADGVTVQVNDLVLVLAESTAANDGVYVVTALGDGATTPGVLTRSTFADSPSELAAMSTNVTSGGSHFGKTFMQSLPASAITVGTTPLGFIPIATADSQVSLVEDDFDTGGASTTGAAIVPATVSFGRLGWRSSPNGTASAVTFVTTGQDSNHKGVIELNTGTTNSGSGAMVRAASGPVNHTTLGTGQHFAESWWVQFPTLSNGTDTYSTELGLGDTSNTAWANGIGLKYSSTGSLNWSCHAVASSVTTSGTGGTATAVTSGVWHLATLTWDGTNLNCYVDRVLVGTVSTGIPTAALSDVAYVLKSAGTTARTMLVDRFIAREIWDTPK